MGTDRYDLSLQDARRSPSPFSLCYISLAKFDEDWHSVIHSHSCAELFYVLRGSGQFRLDSGTVPIGAGDLIFVDPLVRHTEAGTEGKPLEYMVLGIENLELADRPETANRCLILKPQDYSEDVRVCILNLQKEIVSQAPGFEIACCHLAELLAIRLMRCREFSDAAPEDEKSTSRESALVRRYIDRHFKEPISLNLLAEVAHLNKYHMSHTFSRDYGISPISYLLSLRIRESKQLLSSTDHSLAQIAQITGFSSPSYFSQSFRKAVGMSPAQYRTQSRQSSPSAGVHTKEELT